MIVAAVLLGSWAVWLVALARTSWNVGSVATLTIAIAGLDLVIRPTELALGLDRPFPDELWQGSEWLGSLVRAQLAVVVWIVALLVGRSLVEPFRAVRAPRRLLPDTDRAGWLAALMAALGVAAVLPLWIRFGPTGLAAVAKSQTVDLPLVLRFPAVGAAYLGAAVATDRVLRRRRGLHAPSPVVPATAYLLGALVSFSWGARDAAVFALLVVPVVAFAGERRLTSDALRRLRRRMPALVLGALLIVGVGLGLRSVRDQAIAGRSLIETETSTLRQVAVATNHTRYDAFLLVMADAEHLERPGLGEAVDDAVSVVPLVGGAPVELPARTIAAAYVDGRRNGWPLTAVGDWWYLAGPVGVVVGGLISGVVVGLFDRVLAGLDPSRRAVGLALAVLWVTTVASPGGWAIGTPARFRSLFLLPVVLLVLADRLAPATRSTTASGRPTTWEVVA